MRHNYITRIGFKFLFRLDWSIDLLQFFVDAENHDKTYHVFFSKVNIMYLLIRVTISHTAEQTWAGCWQKQEKVSHSTLLCLPSVSPDACWNLCSFPSQGWQKTLLAKRMDGFLPNGKLRIDLQESSTHEQAAGGCSRQKRGGRERREQWSRSFWAPWNYAPIIWLIK